MQPDQNPDGTIKSNTTIVSEPKPIRFVTGASFLFAVLQSLCTAVLAISGIRVAIGLSAWVQYARTVRGSTMV